MIADLLLRGYARFRKALAGGPPCTRTGETVREMEAAIRWLTSPEAAHEILTRKARQIRQRPTEGEPPGLRAARAQLVHHPLRNLEAQVRRADATRRGASAKPDRDLRDSTWAKPLRADRVAFQLLLDAVTRLRHGAVDPYDIPLVLLNSLGVDLLPARRILREALDGLRTLRPAFYRANVTGYLGQELPPASTSLAQSPEELLLDQEEKDAARRTVGQLLAGDAGVRTATARYRPLLARICADAPPNGAELVHWITNEYGITPTAADRFARHLIHLVALADLDWVASQCRTTPHRSQ
ncbi:hypothetical protein GCM10012289_36240 [Nonomuraea cavernae]|uniref:Uncharacterized protein n=2 Tax=Nonomuraea cavernae TaxID=2045107 RepID=A0A918DK19_9ACTN|nr:hypothetical protein GCM10012289_36240 [Nonomuraea cavernae]